MTGRKKGTRGRLSDDQLDARYRWLWKYHKEHDVIPCFKEMAEGWGITVAVVRHTLNRLRDFGWLTTEYHKQRSIRLIRQLD